MFAKSIPPLPSVPPAAKERLEGARQRLVALGIISRTGLAFGLLLALSADLLLLSRTPWYLPFTAIQTLFSLLALGTGLRGVWRSQAHERRDRARLWGYLGILTTVLLIALVEKWWLVLTVENARRASYVASYRVMGGTATLASLLLVLGRSRRAARFFVSFAEHPARQTALSFVAVMVFGAFLLSMPFCNRDPSHVSFLDSLFMAASAVCVTGLSLHDLAVEYTLTGQVVLVALVQIGGLGIMVLSASFLVLTGRKLRVRSSAVLAEVLDAESVSSLRLNIMRIVAFTFVIEALGACLLYVAFLDHPEVALGVTSNHPMAGSGHLWWAAVFHSITAFCNAGFALMHGGLQPFAGSPSVCLVIMVLVLLGGVGFPVLSELSIRALHKVRGQRVPRLSLHTRVVLMMSAILVVGVAVLLGMVEWQSSLAALPWYNRMLAALFQSVALRSAGFAVVDVGASHDAGLMVAMMFMLVGAGPGSTGGGLKVTTFAVLYATLRGELRNTEPHLLDRRLPATTIRRAISVAFVSAIALTFSVLLLLLTERDSAIRLAFEAVSAFATAGLSAGVTPGLSALGKLIIIATMLIGRVGPLTIALATADRGERAHHLHPQERVLIG